ncbi:hypothetical protein GS534_23265 [Rhodococcus hoagii]|nr:hypothetical protein [Prescottella equi]
MLQRLRIPEVAGLLVVQLGYNGARGHRNVQRDFVARALECRLGRCCN